MKNNSLKTEMTQLLAASMLPFSNAIPMTLKRVSFGFERCAALKSKLNLHFLFKILLIVHCVHSVHSVHTCNIRHW